MAAVRGIQLGHMDGNGWMDIGYSAVVCGHRKVFVGRGLHHLPAVNGPGLNGDHYAVLGLVGTSGVATPLDGMLHGIRDAIEWLRDEGDAGNEIKGHRDGYATSCPGDALYAWVRAGALRPSTTTPPVEPPTEEEEVPEVVSPGLTAEATVAPNITHQPWWTEEYRDTAGWHPAGGQSIAPDTDVWADVTAFIALRGLTAGGAVQVGFTRHSANSCCGRASNRTTRTRGRSGRPRRRAPVVDHLFSERYGPDLPERLGPFSLVQVTRSTKLCWSPYRVVSLPRPSVCAATPLQRRSR
ncbi:peptidoglycan recognition family protein [Streptosporangium sp. NPDC000396]|uniref:peptidoglycan recognition protein family protein n=1 Tax=Streptosporangium sp. NPDC000396 TaxID=3366185 RepID=UPI0036C792D8